MDFNTLYPSLVASYEASDHAIPLIDEDFVRNSTGDWVKYRGHWRSSISLKFTNSTITGAFGIKTWHGDVTPWWIMEAQDNHSAFCREVDALPHFAIVTTRDQRILRYAKQRAKEILNSQR